MRAIPSTGLFALFKMRSDARWSQSGMVRRNGGAAANIGWACLSTPQKGNKFSKKWVVQQQERGEKVGKYVVYTYIVKPRNV